MSVRANRKRHWPAIGPPWRADSFANQRRKIVNWHHQGLVENYAEYSLWVDGPRSSKNRWFQGEFNRIGASFRGRNLFGPNAREREREVFL